MVQNLINGFECTISSPTLLDSLNKIMENKENLQRAGDVYSFYHDLDLCIKTFAQKSSINSYQFWVVGNRTVKGINLQTDVIITEIGKKYGLIHVYTIDRNILNKVMPSLNSPNNVIGQTVSTMTNEHIVILRKAE